jgi:antitoxin ChpS
METTLRQFGNSLGVVIPKVLRDSMALSAGQTIALEQTEHGLLLKPITKKISLSELLAQCDPNAAMPEDLGSWESSAVVGNELW